eukprot:GHVR01074901.1.p4 GENE.GHVR01074901.1~~GHVR01074901.1.p4  ORF type:complete len:110 (+),score=2.48 GHVR01074901.1:557-886(+)
MNQEYSITTRATCQQVCMLREHDEEGQPALFVQLFYKTEDPDDTGMLIKRMYELHPTTQSRDESYREMQGLILLFESLDFKADEIRQYLLNSEINDPGQLWTGEEWLDV